MTTLDEAIGAASPDPLAAAVDSLADDTRRSAIYGAVRTNPDQYGQALQLSRVAGVPAAVVNRNLPAVQQRTQMEALDAAIDSNSVLARQMEKPDFANIAHDDATNLKALEEQMQPGRWESVRNSFRRGLPALQQAYHGAILADRAAGLQQLDTIERKLTAGQPLDDAEKDVISYDFTTPEQRTALIAQRRAALRPAIGEAAAGVATTEAEKRAIPQPLVVGRVMGAKTFGDALTEIAKDPIRFIGSIGPESLVSSAPGMLLALPATAYGGPASGAAAIGVNSFYIDYASSVLGAFGDMGVDTSDPNAIRAAAQDPVKLAKAMDQAVKHASVVGGLDALSAGLASKIALPRAVASRLTAKPIAREAANMAVQTPVQGLLGAAGEAGGELYAGQELQPGNILAEAFGELAGAPVEVASMATGRIVEAATKARQAAQDGAALEELSRLSTESKVRPRDVPSFEEFVQASNVDNPVQDVYLDVQALQQAGIDPAALAALSPTAAAQLEEAIATGGDLVIPVSEYAGRIAGSEIDAALLPHLRTSEDALSADEAQRYFQGQQEEIRATAAQVMEEKAADDAFTTSAKAVETKLFDQLTSAGRFTNDVNTAYSTLMRDFYVTTASRLGVTPEEAFARFPLEVRAESVAGEQQLNQGADNGTNRPGLQTSQEPRTVSGGAPRLDWPATTRIRTPSGKPVTVYRGAGRGLTAADFGAGALGHATGNPSSGLGVWFSANRDDAAGYGGVVEGFNLDIRNPKVYRDSDIPAFDSVADAQKFARELQAQGYDGIAVDYRGLGGPLHLVAFNPDSVIQQPPPKPLDLSEFFQGQSQGGNRGEISFARDITQSPSVITLFKNADLSTLLHEMGHFQLEVLANIAGRPDAPQGITDDMAAALNWFKPGMTLDEWNAMPLGDKRPYHEQFARGFEAYLFEGKAPNAELQSLFQRFRAWLTSVYRSMLALNVDINDEIRGVFDRLVATEDSIRAAEAVRSMTPLFGNPDEMGDGAQAWAEYQRLGVEATRDAQDALAKRSVKDMQWLTNARGRVLKALQADAKEKRAAVAAEVRAEVEAMPVYAARKALKDGPKLSIAALEEMYAGEGDRYALLDWKPLTDQRLAGKEGVHPDLAAEQFGYESGDQMVREILAAQPQAEVIEGMTDQRMLERYGDIVSADALARAADEAIHNDARARFVATELKALTKSQGPVRAMTKAAKEFAEAMIARKQVKAIKPNQYATAEARAAKNAERALKAGDSVAAANEKRNQLVQNYATRAAYDAVSEVEKALRYLRKFDSEGVRKKLDTEYTDQIDALLERFDLRAGTTGRDVARRESLVAWVESQRQQGLEPDIPADLLSEALRKPYREMTLEELRGLVDTVKQIEHLGRLKRKLLTAKDEREFAAVTQEISDSIDENSNGRTAETRTPTDALGKLAASLKRFWASHIKAATWSRVMDGGKDGGPMWEYFIRTANEKGDMETQMRADATLALSQILGPVVKTWPKLQGKGRFFATVNRSFTREGAMAVALNTGNEGNLQRLLGGEGWTSEQIRPVLESLTAQEWQAVQAIWDHFESYRPEIGAKERRIYGKEPNWVEPSPFTIATADGEVVSLKGGYYPIKYDPAASQRAEEHADAEGARRDMQGAYTAATTRRSFTKARSEEVTGRPLLYSLVGVYSGVNDVIHDLSWHEWLIDANRLLKSQRIDQAIRGHYGPEVKNQFKQWVKDIAQGESRADHPAEVGVAWLRQGISAAGMGFNVMSAIMQLTGFTQSIVRVGPGYVARGVAQYTANPIASAREVVGKSPFMEARSRTQFRELNELRNQVEGQTVAGRVLTMGTYYLMMRVQKMVDVPTWLGAYEKAIAEGNNEDRSIALADQAVIDAQGSGMVKDLAAVERGGPALKLFTVFYSYMNTALNLGVQVGMTERSKAKLAVKMAMLYTVPAVLGAVLKDALTPGDAGDDDPEKLAHKLVGEQLSYLSGLMVGVREFGEVGRVVAGAEGLRGYSGPAGVRVVGDTVKVAQELQQGEFDDGFRRASINLLGDLTGLPAAQINRTITGVKALDEGKTDNPAAVVLGYQQR